MMRILILILSLVITHKESLSSESLRFININLADLTKKLQKENAKGIWICSGAKFGLHAKIKYHLWRS